MAKANISEYDQTPGNNTVINDIDIDEGNAPSTVNNALRELMAHLADAFAGDQAYDSITNSVTAGATQTQAGATALTTTINRITTVGTDDDGVALPPNVAGCLAIIENADAAQRIQVWPASGASDTIDGGSADAVDANTIPAGGARVYFAVDGTDLRTLTNKAPAAASTTVSGIAELATTAETVTGTDTGRVVTPAGLHGALAGLTDATIATGDTVIFADADDSNNLKEDTVQGILDLVSSGANTALSNLASVAINTSLISDTDATDDLGSASKNWKDLYLSGNVILDSGQGIDFSATADANAGMTSELFDDYEEGIYNPTIVGASSGSYTMDGTFDTLAYTKIGRLVHVQGQISTTADSSLSGNLRISLPTTCAALTEGAEVANGKCSIEGSGTALVGTWCYTTASAAYIQMRTDPTAGGGFVNVNDTNTDGTSNYQITITYISA